MGMAILPAIILCLVIGVLIGMLQGFFISFVEVPSFIVTLVGLLIFKLLTIKLLTGQYQVLDINFVKVVNGFIETPFINLSKGIVAVMVSLILSLIYILIEFFNFKMKLKNGIGTFYLVMVVLKGVLVVSTINILTIYFSKYKGIPNIFLLISVLIVLYIFLNT